MNEVRQWVSRHAQRGGRAGHRSFVRHDRGFTKADFDVTGLKRPVVGLLWTGDGEGNGMRQRLGELTQSLSHALEEVGLDVSVGCLLAAQHLGAAGEKPDSVQFVFDSEPLVGPPRLSLQPDEIEAADGGP